MNERHHGKGYFRAPVLRYLEEHAEAKVFLKDIASAVGCTETQAQSAIYNMRATMKALNIEVVIPAHAWIYHQESGAPANTNSKVFELIKTRPDGTLLLEADDGSLYIAREITI